MGAKFSQQIKRNEMANEMRRMLKNRGIVTERDEAESDVKEIH